MSEMPKVGDIAPDFEAETYGGEILKLSGLKGNIVALYFYPKDNTGTCTKEACSVRDTMDELSADGIRVIGVSTDSVKSHENFRDKYHLNFPLLSDKSKVIIKTYGVESEFGSAKRVTFLIDKKGVIRHVWLKVKAAEHGQEILEKAGELQ